MHGVPANPCHTQCENSGTCVPTYDGGYTCLCTNQYTGVHCESETVVFPCGPGEDLYCLTCHHAWSDEECELVGKYELCNVTNPVCMRLVTIWPGGDKVRINRGCESLDACPVAAYGPEGAACHPHNMHPERERCLQCNYGPEVVAAHRRRLYHCGPVDFGVFYCKGDPHCSTFDGSLFSFTGSCWYVLARDVCAGNQPNGNPNYIISGNINTVTVNGQLRSFVREVSIELPLISLTIFLLHNNLVLVNQVPVDPFPYHDVAGISITKDPNDFVRVSLPSGIMVVWSGKKEIQIEAPSYLGGSLCGVAGDFDGNPSNDNLMGPATDCFGGVSFAGQTALTNELLVSSWFSTLDVNEQTCVDDCTV